MFVERVVGRLIPTPEIRLRYESATHQISADELGGGRHPQLHLGAESRTPEVGRASGGARAGVSQPPTHSRSARETIAPPARRTPGTAVCAPLRDRPHATRAPAGSRQHSETRTAASGRVQSRPPDASPA